jgi:predicted metal-binding membrane protein
MMAAPAAPRMARHQRVFLPLLAALVALAWATLWAWARSPYGRYLEHGDWTASGPAAVLCRALPAGEVLVPVLLYALAWILMTAAMMLPTTLPLFDVFERLTRERHDHARLMLLLGLGYLGAWGAFGLLAHLLHAGLLALAGRVPQLAWNGWMIGAAVIAGAGAFQFSRLKYECLDRCRSPLGFVLQHWRGRAQGRAAFALGLHHGVFCVGCCWALMLLMFAVGAGSLGWMLALAAVMAIEKNARWGRLLGKPLGVALLAWAAALVAAHA